ncbi:MAG: hypothetical protein GC165_06140 [Armatimonadetes bacterium]|nr:hypothetical protein [Armatimonadota bacterium]MBS1726067.1 hypothetical protein [Armatimonadota bacterium]
MDDCSGTPDNPWTFKCCLNTFAECRIYKRRSCYPLSGFQYSIYGTYNGECVKTATEFGGINDPDSDFCVTNTGGQGGG